MPSTAVNSSNRFVRCWTSTIGFMRQISAYRRVALPAILHYFTPPFGGFAGDSSIEQEFVDLVRKVAEVAAVAQHLSLILRLSVVTAKAIRQVGGVKLRAGRMFRLVGPAVFGDVAPGNDDGIALDRGAVKEPGVARRAAFP